MLASIAFQVKDLFDHLDHIDFVLGVRVLDIFHIDLPAFQFLVQIVELFLSHQLNALLLLRCYLFARRRTHFYLLFLEYLRYFCLLRRRNRLLVHLVLVEGFDLLELDLCSRRFYLWLLLDVVLKAFIVVLVQLLLDLILFRKYVALVFPGLYGSIIDVYVFHVVFDGFNSLRHFNVFELDILCFFVFDLIKGCR